MRHLVKCSTVLYFHEINYIFRWTIKKVDDFMKIYTLYSLEKSKVCFSYKPIELRIALIELQETIWLQIYWSSKTIMSMSSVMVLGETPALWGSLNYWFWPWCYSASCLYCSDEMEMWLNIPWGTKLWVKSKDWLP